MKHKIYFRTVGKVKKSSERSYIKRICRQIILKYFQTYWTNKNIFAIVYFSEHDNLNNIKMNITEILYNNNNTYIKK